MILCYKIIQNNCQWASNPLRKVVLSNFNSIFEHLSRAMLWSCYAFRLAE